MDQLPVTKLRTHACWAHTVNLDVSCTVANYIASYIPTYKMPINYYVNILNTLKNVMVVATWPHIV